MDCTWRTYTFADLTADVLYAILQLREKVFVVEQKCAYLDADGLDRDAVHLCGLSDNNLVAYARILRPGTRYENVSIGRVVVAPAYRGKELGKKLTVKALELVESLYGDVPVRVAAQTYLVPFYRAFGFEPLSEFIEDGIPHTHMLRQPERLGGIK